MSARPEVLTLAQARRVALAAQGFLDRPHDPPTMRTLARTVDRTGVLQVDSVNVLQRAHYLPLYSRMGPYDTALLHRATSGREQRRLVEYWAHVQAMMPVELWPHMQHRMAAYRDRRGKWSQVAENPGLEESVLGAVAVRGASTARELEELTDVGAARTKEHWGWNWSLARRMLDYLYSAGVLAIAGRTNSFEVVYDLPERVLPARVLAVPVPEPAEQHRELVRRAAVSHGVATVADLRDYYRMGDAEVRPAVAALVDAGELLPVLVEGRPALLHRDARIPRRVGARAFLSPFDPVVWRRERTERLFGFHYRIEIYVPAEKRIHGYYVLPFLLGEELVARCDLKADRADRRLLVRSAFAEPGSTSGTLEVAAGLAAELRRLAGWLGLDDVVLDDAHGDLVAALGVELAAGTGN